MFGFYEYESPRNIDFSELSEEENNQLAIYYARVKKIYDSPYAKDERISIRKSVIQLTEPEMWHLLCLLRPLIMMSSDSREIKTDFRTIHSILSKHSLTSELDSFLSTVDAHFLEVDNAEETKIDFGNPMSTKEVFDCYLYGEVFHQDARHVNFMRSHPNTFDFIQMSTTNMIIWYLIVLTKLYLLMEEADIISPLPIYRDHFNNVDD